jgi:hypothetical protein
MLQYRVLAGSVADVNGFNCGPGSIVMIGFFEAGQYLALKNIVLVRFRRPT